MESSILSIDKSYWVIPGRFRAGEYPGSIHEEEARSKLRWLLELGIDFFLDLTQSGEYDLIPYAPLLAKEAGKRRKPVKYVHIPIRDFSIPTEQEMVNILDIIELSLIDGKNIYMHCFGGKGRTGMVVGCYLARHGMPGDQSLEMIQDLRKDLPDAGKLSPETDEQRRIVQEWIKGR